MLADLWSQGTDTQAGRRGGQEGPSGRPGVQRRRLHDVHFLGLGEVEDFFGSRADNFVILADGQQRLENKADALEEHNERG